MEHTRGFTIVELAIVIIVVVILATIALVSYNGIQQSAADAALRVDLDKTAKQVSIWLTRPGNSITRLRQIFGGRPAYIEGIDAQNSLASTALRWDSLTELPKIPVNRQTTMEVLARNHDVIPRQAQIDENNLYLAANDEFCLTATAPNSTFNYSTGIGVHSQYDKILFYDSLAGGIRTLDELGAVHDSGGRTSCLSHIFMYRQAIGQL